MSPRKSRRSSILRKPEASRKKRANVGLDQLESVASDGGVSLLKRRRRTVQAAVTLSYRFSNLPIELQIKVFELAIEGDNSILLMLTHVCQRWREIIIAKPSFWRHLVLTGSAKQEWVDTWLHRAGGFLSSLLIDFDFSFLELPDVFRNAAPDMWSRLDSFEFDQDYESTPEFYEMLPEILSQLQANSLRIILPTTRLSSTTKALSSKITKALHDMDASRLRCLSLSVFSQMTLDCLTFPALTDFKYSGFLRTDGLFAFMERNSQIESLMLEWRVCNAMDVNVPKQPVVLTNLRRLLLSGRLQADAFCRAILFPNLEVLTFDDADDCDSWLEVIALQRLVRLETVILRGGAAHPAALIDFLQKAVAVRRLFYDFWFLSSTFDDDGFVLGALSRMVPARDGHDLSGSLCCPRLQHLSVVSGSEYIARPLVELVKARLPTATLPSGVEPRLAVSNCQSQGDPLPLPIISLVLEDCHNIYNDHDSLTWLQANVPKVTIC